MISGVIVVIGVGLCCVGLLVLFLFGISGFWISNLMLLELYRLIFIVLVIVVFGFVGWKVYWFIEKCE